MCPGTRSCFDPGGEPTVYSGWILCGGSHNWDTCQDVARMVGQAEPNSMQPILATSRHGGCTDHNCLLARSAARHQSRHARLTAPRRLNQAVRRSGTRGGCLPCGNAPFEFVAIEGVGGMTHGEGDVVGRVDRIGDNFCCSRAKRSASRRAYDILIDRPPPVPRGHLQ
jgi:hypothetical protein